MSPLLAQSGHRLVHRTCLLLTQSGILALARATIRSTVYQLEDRQDARHLRPQHTNRSRGRGDRMTGAMSAFGL